MSVKLDSLGRVPLFEGLAEHELDSIAARTREVTVEAGTEVIRQGEPGANFFILIHGALEIRVGGRVVRHLGPGDFLGELALLFNAPRSATAVALEPSSLLVMESDDFHALLAEAPAIEEKVMAVVAERMRYR